MGTVTAINLPHLVRALRGIGADPEAIMGELAQRMDVRFEDRIPVATLIDVWEASIAATGRRDLPAITVRYAVHDERSLVSFVIANQPRYTDGIDRFHRFAPTISDVYCYRVVDSDADIRVVMSPIGPIHRLGWQCYIECEVLDVVRSAERLSGARPLALRFLHPAPPREVIDAFAETAGIEPVFGHSACEVVYPRSVRELTVPDARPALGAVVEARLEAMLEAIERNAVVATRARNAIAELLDQGSPSGVDEVARTLKMSRRSLERALADEGTSAGALLEDERKQRAVAWLPTMSVDEVAQKLGYSDSRAFARAFKRWTGVSPRSSRG